MCLCCGSLINLNSNSIYLARYALMPYGFTLLTTTLLFFVFLRLSEYQLDRQSWLYISIISVPIAFFSDFITVVPISAGALLITLIRTSGSSWSKKVSGVAATFWELRALSIFPIMYLARQLIHPFTNLGADRRPDMARLFFPTSGYSSDFGGVFHYAIARTYDLFVSMLVPLTGRDILSYGVIGMWLIAFIYGCIMIILHRAERRALFTLLYLILNVLVVSLGGCIGIYPYGSIRYTPYLLVPGLIIAGIGASSFVTYVITKLRITVNTSIPVIIVSALICICGVRMCWGHYMYVTEANTKNVSALTAVRFQPSYRVLCDTFTEVIIKQKLPEYSNRIISLGRPAGYNLEPQDSGVFETVCGPSTVCPSGLSVILHCEVGKAFPLVNKAIEEEYVLDDVTVGPNVWVGNYHKRSGP